MKNSKPITEPNPHQAMLPHGMAGRVFAWLMDLLNTPAYRRAAAILAPTPGDSMLEIGFGTGGLAVRLAPRLGAGLLAGVDPSPLMVRRARRRLERLRLPFRIELREGTDRSLEWPSATFTHIAALHSFQFWGDPRETLPRLRELLKPDGRLLLILRHHGPDAPQWLPNSISRSGREVDTTLRALRDAGFGAVTQHPSVGRSAVVTARRVGTQPSSHAANGKGPARRLTLVRPHGNRCFASDTHAGASDT